MRYKITEDIKKDNPEIQDIPELMAIPNRTLKYIFYVYDFDSPYRNMELSKRKNRALDVSGFKKESDGSRWDKNAREVYDEKSEDVRKAVRIFIDIQDNIEKMILQAYDCQLSDFIELMNKKSKTDEEKNMALKIMKDMPSFMAKRKELMEIIGNRVSSSGVTEKPQTTLEKFNIASIHEKSNEKPED